MTKEERIYIANMMDDVKSSMYHLSANSPETGADKIELNFYRIADAIKKMVGKSI